MTRVRVLFTRAFWLDAGERAVKSFGQGALLAGGTARWTALELDVVTVVSAGAGMAILSIVTSVASAPVPGMSPASILRG